MTTTEEKAGTSQQISETAPRHLQYLMELGVFDTEHSGRTLGEHLVRTHDIMVTWGCPESWCLAGLYHSIYGTTVFLKQTTNDRDAVREVIGEKAEKIAYIFCQSEPKRSKWIRENVEMWDGDNNITYALLALNAANNLEQGFRSRVQYYMKDLPPKLAENILQTELNLLGEWEVADKP